MTKLLVFELELRTSNRQQDILYTTLGVNDVIVNINSIILYLPSVIPNTETQVIFNEVITKFFHNIVWIMDDW